MTVESVTTIELGDILAIRYKCEKCGGVTSVPIDVEHSVPGKCQSCRQQWFSSIGDPRQQAIYDLVVLLRHVKEVVSGFKEQKVQTAIRLEISNQKAAHV